MQIISDYGMIKEFERNLKEKGRSVSMAKKQQDYGNESITMLKGPDKVRKRPGVIFGSDGLDGCEHSVFEVLLTRHVPAMEIK